ncbi:hypothetical protein B5M44_24975 [Shinella sumterensis]|uniref:hypothetical protein n=1 Tax=Shinella sumterensis TaxID=1967501 RepID=UPI00106E1D18|nr:hypothetical protein [Shinella sumterensis]MCD1266047.1 hypothetical protein [Shinella sumterensis]TFE93525.1 hypothetical protein B5M44_24975 [Shinella sumterensis]
MISFLEAYILYGPDVEKIALAVGIKPHEADRQINEEMNRRHAGFGRGALSEEALAWRDRNRDLCASLFREARG